MKIIPIDFTPNDSKLTFIKQTVIGWRKRNPKKVVHSKALYKCQCGNLRECCISQAKRGKVKSCGCLKVRQKDAVTKHGLWNTPLYNIWVDIKNRCYKSRHQAYKYYGARGVRMCDEWYNDVTAFVKWCIDNNWKPGLQVDKDIIPRKSE